MSLKNRDGNHPEWMDVPSDEPITGFPITRTVGWVEFDPRGKDDAVVLAFTAIGGDVAAHADGSMSEELTYTFDPSGHGSLPLVVNVARRR